MEGVEGPERTCAEHGCQPHLIAGFPFLVDLLEEPCVVGTEVLEKIRAGYAEQLGPQWREWSSQERMAGRQCRPGPSRDLPEPDGRWSRRARALLCCIH
jgi:hypothetical protein